MSLVRKQRSKARELTEMGKLGWGWSIESLGLGRSRNLGKQTSQVGVKRGRRLRVRVGVVTRHGP
jgi:hypothetical protein